MIDYLSKEISKHGLTGMELNTSHRNINVKVCSIRILAKLAYLSFNALCILFTKWLRKNEIEINQVTCMVILASTSKVVVSC